MSKLNDEQIDQICLGIKNGLSMEQVNAYANPELSAKHMREIRRGLENGLSVDQVAGFTKPDLSSKQIRQGLHDLVVTAAE